MPFNACRPRPDWGQACVAFFFVKITNLFVICAFSPERYLLSRGRVLGSDVAADRSFLRTRRVRSCRVSIPKEQEQHQASTNMNEPIAGTFRRILCGMVDPAIAPRERDHTVVRAKRPPTMPPQNM